MNTRAATVRLVSLAGLAGLAQTTLAQCPVPAPTGLSASQGTYCGSVFLDWVGVSGPILGYKVWRNTTNSVLSASWIGTSLSTQFTDITASVGTKYYYWVDVERLLCVSNYSTSASGFRAQDPAAPSSITATDGTICGAVKVAWTQPTAALGATIDSFTIYRNTSNIYLTASNVGAVGGSVREFLDFSAAPATTYYYWVRAENLCGNAASDSSSGYTSSLPAPANNNCSAALPVTSGSTYVGSTVCATNDGSSACGAVGSPGRDVWYRFTAPGNGTLHTDTCGVSGSFNTVLSVHVNACPASAATQYQCNDDFCGQLSSLDVPVSQGLSYLIRVAGQSANDFGVFELHVGFTPSACYANCDGTGGLTGNDFQCFLNAYVAGQSYANCDGVGGLTGNDFQCFLDKYVAGCS